MYSHIYFSYLMQEGFTPLFHACRAMDCSVLSKLIERGADLDATSEVKKHSKMHNNFSLLFQDGSTALMIAAKRNRPDCIQVLMTSKANPNNNDEVPKSYIYISTYICPSYSFYFQKKKSVELLLFTSPQDLAVKLPFLLCCKSTKAITPST